MSLTTRRALIRTISFVAMFCLALYPPVRVRAQQLATATISGEVIDPAGKTIARANVTLRNSAQGTARTSSTDDQGNFAFSNIEAGAYQVTIAPNSGFAAYKQDVIVAVGQVLRLPVRLAVGTSLVEVQVNTDSQATLDTETSVVGDVISSQQIENLPLNGRNYLELALLVPGNTPAPNFDPTKQHTVLISSAGK